jgi:hypothetical protein
MGEGGRIGKGEECTGYVPKIRGQRMHGGVIAFVCGVVCVIAVIRLCM